MLRAWFWSHCSNEKPDMSSALSMLLLMSAFVCAVRGQMNPPLPKCQMGLAGNRSWVAHATTT